MENKDLVTEISTYSLDDLKLIYETQRDLYSEEEMKIIFKRIQDIEMAEVERKQAFITEHLPNEIICPKCDGPNSFENEKCCFCGHVFDKRKFYTMEHYESNEANKTDVEKEESFMFQYIISFIVPLVAFILGAILLGKDDYEEKRHGKICIILGIISIVISFIFGFLLVSLGLLSFVI